MTDAASPNPTDKFNHTAEMSPAAVEAYQRALIDGRLRIYDDPQENIKHAVIATDPSHEIDDNGVLHDADGNVVQPLNLETLDAVTVEGHSPAAPGEAITYPLETPPPLVVQSLDPVEMKQRQAFEEGRLRLVNGEMQVESAAATVQRLVAPDSTNPKLSDGHWGHATAVALRDKLQEVQEKNGLSPTGRYDGGEAIQTALRSEFGAQDGAGLVTALDELQSQGKFDVPLRSKPQPGLGM